MTDKAAIFSSFTRILSLSALALLVGGCSNTANTDVGDCVDTLQLTLVPSAQPSEAPIPHRISVRFDGQVESCTLNIPQRTLQAGEGIEGSCSAATLRFEAVRPGGGGRCAADDAGQTTCDVNAAEPVTYLLWVFGKPAQIAVSVHRDDELVVAEQQFEPNYTTTQSACSEAELTLALPCESAASSPRA